MCSRDMTLKNVTLRYFSKICQNQGQGKYWKCILLLVTQAPHKTNLRSKGRSSRSWQWKHWKYLRALYLNNLTKFFYEIWFVWSLLHPLSNESINWQSLPIKFLVILIWNLRKMPFTYNGGCLFSLNNGKRVLVFRCFCKSQFSTDLNFTGMLKIRRNSSFLW